MTFPEIIITFDGNAQTTYENGQVWTEPLMQRETPPDYLVDFREMFHLEED